jgi:hypothetical protein
VVIGFRFTIKWSIETGLFTGKKSYSGEGRYFNMKNISATMPAGMVLNKITGKTSFLEIPLALNYRVLHRNYSSLYVSGGISTYIVTTEKNKYEATYNGIAEKLFGNYKENKIHFPAVISFGVNYEYAIGKNIKIRLAPYLKIPVNGMGVGNLPVASTGISMGIIKNLFK